MILTITDSTVSTAALSFRLGSDRTVYGACSPCTIRWSTCAVPQNIGCITWL